ncbi:type II toxin-antitoxin system PemK/MazF family toxin [Fastidiosibacter lacustris]|uniref:type II toxin-antitoxin system PemK/MazF family toxin n=1 Tax=Fastidiosibacter lacustris TaxID=2056695 RepID=UPI000E34C1DD|nr:type II toxin-antitoxin system PemK/MazF family toxin [Fastidiosibacter lacustris]
MKKYIPDQGDIIWLDFDPSLGREIMKRRPALVLTKAVFNDHTGFTFVAPITSVQRSNKFEVTLPGKCKTKGSILTFQIRSMDFKSRNAEKIETCPKTCLDEILKISKVILS